MQTLMIKAKKFENAHVTPTFENLVMAFLGKYGCEGNEYKILQNLLVHNNMALEKLKKWSENQSTFETFNDKAERVYNILKLCSFFEPNDFYNANVGDILKIFSANEKTMLEDTDERSALIKYLVKENDIILGKF